MSESHPFGDDLADEASKFLQSQGNLEHLHAQYHEHEKKGFDIAEQHGWTPEGIAKQKEHRRKGGFIAGALQAANNGPFYTDGVGCNICGHRDSRAYEGQPRRSGKNFTTDIKFNEIVENEENNEGNK